MSLDVYIYYYEMGLIGVAHYSLIVSACMRKWVAVGYGILVAIAKTIILVPYLLTHWPLGEVAVISRS